jgi:hypothetical protein
VLGAERGMMGRTGAAKRGNPALSRKRNVRWGANWGRSATPEEVLSQSGAI